MSRFFSSKLSALKPYTPGEQPKDFNKVIKLNTNESPFAPSKKAIKAGKARLKTLQLYPDPTASGLRRAIASGLNVGEDMVAVSNGSDETLAFFFAGFCENGAVYNDITYGFYKVFAALYGVKSTVIPLKEDYSIDVNDYVGKTGTVFIANPNAPTGLALGREEIAKLAEQDKDRLIVVDEAYVDFGGESAIELIAEHDNIAVVRTFSKSRSLAGGRLGFVVASREVLADFERVRNSFNPYNVNAVTLAMGEAAFEDEQYFERTRRTVMLNREVLTDALKGMGFTVLISSTNFIFACPPDKNGERLYTELKKRNVLVRYFDADRLREYCRITVGSADQVTALVSAVREIY